MTSGRSRPRTYINDVKSGALSIMVQLQNTLDRPMECGKMNDNVLISVLLHLPLQLFRRLPGMNRRLDRHMKSEHFWRLKCKIEFHLLPETIPNFRYYYLLCSRSGYGRLFCGIAIDNRFKRVKAVEATPGALGILIYADDKITLSNNDAVLASEVDYFNGRLFRSQGINYYINLDTTITELPWRQNIVKYEQFLRCTLVLFADGELLVETLGRGSLTSIDLHNVLDFRYDNESWLYVLYRNNTVVAYDEGQQVTFEGKYIKMGGKHLNYHQLYRTEGVSLSLWCSSATTTRGGANNRSQLLRLVSPDPTRPDSPIPH